MNTNLEEDTRYFEGCGHEGPIRCIFLSEFHPVAGPKITCQVRVKRFVFRCRYVSFRVNFFAKPVFRYGTNFLLPRTFS
jgi:hypothetical protein